MAEPVGRTILVINGRVLELGPARATHTTSRAGWWRSLALFGGTLLLLGIPIGAGVGSLAAIAGVVFFVAAGEIAGSERYELATALGAAGVVWTSAGIAVALGTDPSLALSALLCAVAGALLVFVGGRNSVREQRRDRRRSVTA